MRKTLFVGFVTLLPLVLTIMVISWLFNLFTNPLAGIMEDILHAFNLPLTLQHHDKLVAFISRIMSLVCLFLLILVLGFLGRKFFFSALMNGMNAFFLRIPVVGSIYRVSKEVTSSVFSQKEKTFKKTVLVPFPKTDTHALGFVTGDLPKALQKVIDDKGLSVFVPTAPHPLSGFLLLTAKKRLLPVDMSVEDGFKFLVSCGMIHPGQELKEKNE